MRIKLIPLSSVSFGTGKPFSPQMRGPVSHQSSYVVPFPSTFAGTLAFLAYKENPNCANVNSNEPFASTRNCLKKLLGENFSIRGPFAEVEVNSENGVRNVLLFQTYKGLAELPLTKDGLERLLEFIEGI